MSKALHRSAAWLVAAAAIVAVAARRAPAASLDWEGICDYGAGHYEEAAVELRAAFAAEHGRSARLGYFLARSLAELGLRSRAAALLEAVAERRDDRVWRPLARRELARLRFEARDREALLAMSEAPGAAADPEIAYLAGLAAAELDDWRRARELLAAVPAASPLFVHARYLRAQSAAAAGDLEGALVDLNETVRAAPARISVAPKRLRVRELFEPAEGDLGPFALSFRDVDPAVDIRDRAQVLRGKILYLQGRLGEAREAFAAVEGGGAVALEAMRGLAVAGDPEVAARVPFAPKRPLDRAAVLAARALAAERAGDVAAEWLARDEIDAISRQRLDALDRLAADDRTGADLLHDLAVFEARIGEARAERRWREERERLETTCSFERSASAGDVAFRPGDPLFYALWTESRSSAWLRDLVAIAADALRLARDLRSTGDASTGWTRIVGAQRDLSARSRLRVLRASDLEERLALHLHRFHEIDDAALEARRRRAVGDAARELRLLYVGITASVSPPDDAPRSSPAASAAALDALADDLERAAAAAAAEGRASVYADAALDGRLHRKLIALSREIAGRVRGATRAAVRLERAAVQRVSADNERSRSLLLGRIDATRK